jgi:hypothetical protein
MPLLPKLTNITANKCVARVWCGRDKRARLVECTHGEAWNYNRIPYFNIRGSLSKSIKFVFARHVENAVADALRTNLPAASECYKTSINQVQQPMQEGLVYVRGAAL